jgi:hypothetical protein
VFGFVSFLLVLYKISVKPWRNLMAFSLIPCHQGSLREYFNDVVLKNKNCACPTKVIPANEERAKDSVASVKLRTLILGDPQVREGFMN